MSTLSLPANASMRDIFEYCEQQKLPSLAQGMVEFAPPKLLREIAAKITLQDNVHTYRDRYGDAVFRNGVRNLLKHQYGIEEPENNENIIAVCGVTAGCVTTLMWLKSQGKTKIGLYYPFYTYHLKEIQNICQTEPVYIASNGDFSPNFDNIVSAIENDNIQVLLVCNPGNPHTRVWRRDEMDRLVDLCRDRNVFLIIDECYCDMVWGDRTHYSPVPPFRPAFEEHVVMVRGFSKQLGCQSWRVGYVLAHKNVIPQLMNYGDPIYVGAPFVQCALGEYLTNHIDDFKRHVQAGNELMQRNWKRLSAAFKDALGWEPLEPEGSMYGMFRHNNKTDRDAVVQALEAGVGVCPGNIFWPNMPDNTQYIRIHCGISEEKAKQIEDKLRQYAAAKQN